MDKETAVSCVYKSYEKAAKNLNREWQDSKKRNPALTREWIRSLCKAPAIVITGSKGKGSVAYMLAKVLELRKKTGLMTSPHINDFTERFRINSKVISDEKFCGIMSFLQEELDRIERDLSEWEYISPMGIQAVAALHYFNGENTDINVFECGKGAAYDDVNNVIHEYAVINTIFMEHTRELGNSIEEIARDKAAIITSDTRCVYMANQIKAAEEVILARAKMMQIPVKTYGVDFWCENTEFTPSGMKTDVVLQKCCYRNLELPLLGEHQVRNLALALAVVADIEENITEDELRECLKQLNWPGRMEMISAKPPVVLDACINRDSAENVKNVLKKMPVSSWDFIIGVPDDKDYAGVIETVSDMAENIFLVKTENPYYIFSDIQAETIKKIGHRPLGIMNLAEAVNRVKKNNRACCILGTTGLVSQVHRQKQFLFGNRVNDDEWK